MALTTIPASLSATALTLTTAAQPNVTSLGTLTSLTGGTGDLTWDTNTLFVDSSANKVGMGTSSPTAVLDVRRGDASGAIAEFHTSTGFGIELGSSASEAYIQAGANQALLFKTSGSNERMRITSAGDVGIGITPSSALSIYRASGVNAYIEVAGNNNTPGSTSMLFGQDDNNYGYCWNRANQAVLFGTNGTERLRIDASGNVGIDETNPAAYGKFVVKGTATQLALNASSGKARVGFFENGTGRFYIDTLNGSDGLAFVDADGSSERMRIDSSGNVSVSPGTFTASNVINIATDSSVQTTTARQWATIKNTGTGAGDYSEMRISNNANDYIIFGSIGSNYTNVNWSNSSYLYANRELRIKSNNALRFFSGGMDLNTHDNMVLESSGHLTLKGQIVGGFGAIGTGGTTDWNHSTNARSGMGYTLLLGNATNGPGGSGYYHPVTFEYSAKNGTGNMTQLAIPYYGSSSIYIRTRYSGTWTSWGTV